MVIVFMTNMGSIFISNFAIVIGLCVAHSAFHVLDDLFLDEQEVTRGFCPSICRFSCV